MRLPPSPEQAGRATASLTPGSQRVQLLWRREPLGKGGIRRYLQFPPHRRGIFCPLSRGQQEKAHFLSPSKSYFNNRSMWGEASKHK